MNRIVIVGLIILVLLIALTAFLSSFIQNKSASQNARPTLIPTTAQGLNNTRKVPIVRTTPSSESVTRSSLYEYTNNLTQDKKDALESFNQKLPYKDPSFEIGYSPYLNQYFTEKTDPDAQQKLDEFLQQNNVLDIKSARGDLFVSGSEPVTKQILKAEEEFVKKLTPESEVTTDTSPSAPAADPTEDPVSLAGKTLFSFNFGAPKAKTSSNPANVSSTAQALLNNPRLRLTSWARSDLEKGIVNQQIINILAWLLQKHTIFAGYFLAEHGGCPGKSNHCYGRAVDIDGIDGPPVTDSNGAARVVSDEILALSGPLKPSELGQPFYDGNRNGVRLFTDGHHDHMHIGYDQ